MAGNNPIRIVGISLPKFSRWLEQEKKKNSMLFLKMDQVCIISNDLNQVVAIRTNKQEGCMPKISQKKKKLSLLPPWMLKSSKGRNHRQQKFHILVSRGVSMTSWCIHFLGKSISRRGSEKGNEASFRVAVEFVRSHLGLTGRWTEGKTRNGKKALLSVWKSSVGS